MRLFFFQTVIFASSLFQIRTTRATPAYTVKEEIIIPQGWIRHSRAPPSHILALKIALPQPKFGELERHLYEVSDPDHARYGQHLSKEEVEELVAPHPESLDAVNDWLLSLGFTDDAISRSPGRDWINIRVPVSIAESMLDTVSRLVAYEAMPHLTSMQEYYIWEHSNSGEYLVRTTAYSLPHTLHNHIELVQPTTVFSRFKAHKSNVIKAEPFTGLDNKYYTGGTIVSDVSETPIDASCNHAITIKCLQQLYNVGKFEPSGEGNSIGITGYLVRTDCCYLVSTSVLYERINVYLL